MKTKTITLPNLELLVVEIPERAINPVISMGYITARIPNREYMAKYDPTKEHDDWAKKLDVDGDWKHLGAVSDVAEEQAAGLVDAYDDGYFYYPDGYKDTCDTALESLHSLLEANGWDGETSRTHLFIKQK